MRRTDPPWHWLDLGIGRLTMRLECNQRSLADALRQRYLIFVKEREDHADLHLRLILSEQALSPSTPGAQINAGGTQISFTYPGFEGNIDLTPREGTLTLKRPDPFPDIQLYLSLALNTLALQRGGFLLHAAGIAHRGRGFLFLGPSGAGKTTISRFSSNDLVLNDDLSLVLPENGGWSVSGTPFTNPHQAPPHPGSVPIAAMMRLRQSATSRLEPLARAAALAELVSSVALLASLPPLTTRVLEVAQQLLETIPGFDLYFRKDASFWQLIDDQLASV